MDAKKDGNMRKKQRNPRRKFTDEEDKRLKKLVNILGDKSWPMIAAAMGEGRTTRQCRERYKTYLSPDLKNDPWTPEEDQKLIRFVDQYGTKWATIAHCFPGRSDNNLKNRWNTYLSRNVRPKTNLNPISSNFVEPPFIDSEDDIQYSLDDIF